MVCAIDTLLPRTASNATERIKFRMMDILKLADIIFPVRADV